MIGRVEVGGERGGESNERSRSEDVAEGIGDDGAISRCS